MPLYLVSINDAGSGGSPPEQIWEFFHEMLPQSSKKITTSPLLVEKYYNPTTLIFQSPIPVINNRSLTNMLESYYGFNLVELQYATRGKFCNNHSDQNGPFEFRQHVFFHLGSQGNGSANGISLQSQTHEHLEYISSL